jgi:hypothetical protein
MENQRDYRKEKKQMDQQAGALEHDKTTEPHDNQNHCENEKHGTPTFYCKGLALGERYL